MTADVDVEAEQKPSAYEEGEMLVLRASSLGSCTKRLVMHAIGVQGSPPPDWLQRAFDDGNRLEQPIISRMLQQERGEVGWPGPKDLIRAGFVFGGPRHDQLELSIEVPGKVKVVCHPDGVVWDGMEACTREDVNLAVLEVKALAAGTKVDSIPSYAWQWAVEMHAANLVMPGIKGLYVVGRKDGEGGLVDGDVEVTRYADVSEAPYTLGQIKARMLSIHKAWLRALDEGVDMECDAKDYPCPMWETHDGRGVWADESVVVDDGDDLARLLREYQEAKARVKEEEEARDEYKTQIREALDRLSIGTGTKVRCGGYTVKWQEVAVEETVQVKKAHVRSFPDVREAK